MNTAMQGISGNINSTGDFWKAMGIGALSGLAGYGAGALMSSEIAPVGIIGGGLTGAAGGAASGFVGGAGNAWVNGANFNDGLKAGLTSSGWGALGGALVGGITGGITSYKHGGNIWTGEGATFISDLEDSMFGITEADKSPINTNKQVQELLNKKGVNLSDYKVSRVDVESGMLGIEDEYFTYWRQNGMIHKAPISGGEAIDIAGTTISKIHHFRPISDIYISTHNTIPNFMKTLNHEFIHSWQFAKFGYMNSMEWSRFKEASAMRYTQLYYPTISVPSYSGYMFPLLYCWPKLPSVY